MSHYLPTTIDLLSHRHTLKKLLQAVKKLCTVHLSIVAGLVVRHGDLSHEMTLSHEGRRPECDNVNRV